MNIEKILEDILSGTDFEVYGITENNVELEITLTGDNPENEDWTFPIYVKLPEDMDDLIRNLHNQIRDYAECFDIEEEVFLKLEAKRNGLSGVPGVVDLVDNEEYKQHALVSLSRKLENIVNNMDNPKWIVISVEDNDIQLPDYFSTYDKAYEYMKKQYNSIVEYGDTASIHDDYASVQTDCNTFAWRIIGVSEEMGD